MRSSKILRAFQQLSSMPRQPMIKFIGARLPRPKFDPNTKPSFDSSHSSKFTTSSSVLEFSHQLPLRFQRREISDEEIEVLNVGFDFLENNDMQQRSAELHSLFLCLIESCANQSAVDEQRSLAQFIEPLFTGAAEVSAATYTFLASPIPGSVQRKKDETSKSKKTKIVLSKQKGKATPSPSTQRDGSRSFVSATPSTKASGGSTSLGNTVKSQDDVLQRSLKAIELSADDVATMLLCRLLQGYITYCKNTVNQKRLRRMTRLDGANYFLRTIRSHFTDSNPSPTRIFAIDALARALMIISSKDRKLMMKVRLCGILPLLANRILEADRLFTTVTLLRLASRCLRSARNAQIIGREKRFAERFVAILNAFTASMKLAAVPAGLDASNTSLITRPSVSNSSTVVAGSLSSPSGFSLTELPSTSVLLHCKTNIHKDDPINPAKMARLVEILFFTAKNKHIKTQLLENDALSVLKTIFENHFERRHLDAVHLEISLIAAATIRQFSKTKKGKEQLQQLSIQSMCEKYIGLLTEDRQHLTHRPKTLVLYTQLQDSLCALCMRCLPHTPYPMEGIPFPLKYSLPIIPGFNENTGTPQRPEHTNMRTPLSRKQKFQKQSTPTSGKGIEKLGHKIDDAASSDDDVCDEEEEDSLFIFNATGEGSSTSLLQANETGANYSDDDDECGGGNNADAKINPAYVVANYSRQNLADLKSNYREHFIEMEQDAITTGDCSPKLRKTVSGSRSDGQISSLITEELSRPGPSSLFVTFSDQKQQGTSYREAILAIAQHTKSVGRFIKIAYPELVDVSELSSKSQSLLHSIDSMRGMITNTITKSRLQNIFERRVVYDLDRLLSSNVGSNFSTPLTNDDLLRIGYRNTKVPNLMFESRFESGNLRRVIQVSPTHYELILSPDINATRPHYQWFYFEVCNNDAGVEYTFEIVNCLKNSSMFSRGMQPVLFSVTEASRGNPCWVRAANSVCYYRNLYSTDDSDEKSDDGLNDPSKSSSNKSGTAKKTAVSMRQKTADEKSPKSGAINSGIAEMKNYFSTRFTLQFEHAGDVCYLAYHFPYTYSYLNATLENVILRCTAETPTVYIRSGVLTKTLAGNPVRVVTITAPGSVRDICARKIVLLSARVHPGESNSSWIMHGILQCIASPVAAKARELFVFKIVPMLNPDGVINGSHRCSLSGVDLNRVYNNPSDKLHPTIFHMKGLIQYMIEVMNKRPFAFVDLHGHSRKSNIFVYGNNPEESWRNSDHSIEHNYEFMTLPEELSRMAPAFSLSDCRFSVTKAKEFSARIAIWRQFGIERTYTMEASYCGFDVGPYAGRQITITNLMEMGANLCKVLTQLNAAEENNFMIGQNSKSPTNTEVTAALRNESPLRGPITRLSAKRIAAHFKTTNTKKHSENNTSTGLEAVGTRLTTKEHKKASEM